MIDYKETRSELEAAFAAFKEKVPSELNTELVVKYLDQNLTEWDEADEDSIALSMDVYVYTKGVVNEEDKYCVASLWLDDPEKAERDDEDEEVDFAKEEAEEKAQFLSDLDKFFTDMENEISPTEFVIKAVEEQNLARAKFEKELKKSMFSIVLLSIVCVIIVAAVVIVGAMVF
ncbi:MAG: hypothetical protein IJY65_04170 [Clostridia bacterium]|nr:hypothetical protein [Clostridia bacterium]